MTRARDHGDSRQWDRTGGGNSTSDHRLLPIGAGDVASDAATRLYCFAHAGASASVFAPWGRAPGFRNLRLLAVRYPGRETRHAEPAPHSLAAMVQDLGEELSGHWQGHFAFFGHSFGALVAWELARLLVRTGRTLPQCLIVAGARAPGASRPEPIHDLDDVAFLDAVEKFGGMSPEVRAEPALMELALPILRKDFRLMETHVPEPGDALPIPISMAAGTQDAHVPLAMALAWSASTSRSFRARFFEGGHFFPFTATNELAAAIAEDLEACRAPAEVFA